MPPSGQASQGGGGGTGLGNRGGATEALRSRRPGSGRGPGQRDPAPPWASTAGWAGRDGPKGAATPAPPHRRQPHHPGASALPQARRGGEEVASTRSPDIGARPPIQTPHRSGAVGKPGVGRRGEVWPRRRGASLRAQI